jgi:hypothetical protein
LASIACDELEIVWRFDSIPSSPVRYFDYAKAIVSINESFEVLSKSFTCRVHPLEAPTRLKDSNCLEAGQFVIERLVVAGVSKIVINKEESHGIPL